MQVKVDLMRKIQREKFTQNKDIQQVLLSVRNKEIIEYHPRDKFWGNGGTHSSLPAITASLIGDMYCCDDAGDGSGANTLGKLLMEVRDSLAQQ